MISKKRQFSGVTRKAVALAVVCGLAAGVFGSCDKPTGSITAVSGGSLPSAESSTDSKAVSSVSVLSEIAEISSTANSIPIKESSAVSRNAGNSASSYSLSVTYSSVPAVALPESLIDSLKNPMSLMLSGFAACLYDVPAKNEAKTAAEVQSMLVNAVPYSGTVPRSPNGHFSFNAYFGPCFLMEQTRDGHEVKITPYTYFTFTAASCPPGESGGSCTLHYVPDLIVVKVDGKASYLTSHDLYTWMEDKQCKSEFDMNHDLTGIPISAVASSGVQK